MHHQNEQVNSWIYDLYMRQGGQNLQVTQYVYKDPYVMSVVRIGRGLFEENDGCDQVRHCFLAIDQEKKYLGILDIMRPECSNAV